MRFLTLSVVALLFGFSANVQAQVAITEIDLANNRIEIVNTGNSAVDLSNWWVCNRFNGSPFYDNLTDQATIDTQLSTAGSSIASFGAGDILVLDIADGDFLPDVSGEFGLYNSATFGSSAAIEDYVAWGADVGVRDTVADAAGLWTSSDFIDISGLGANETIQLTFGEDSVQASDFSFASSSFGTFASSVPEPGSITLCGVVAAGLLMRRRR